ncbi:hypothetical protein ACF0H5_022306 [Mactra antiquata]
MSELESKEFWKVKKRVLTSYLIVLGFGGFLVTYIVENDRPTRIASVFKVNDVTKDWVKAPGSSFGSSHSRNTKEKMTSLEESNTSPDAYVDTQKNRLHLINNICLNKTLLKSSSLVRPKFRRVYFTTKYNFSFCKVPKIGSTFWTQVFQVLESNRGNYGEIFGRKRAEVHGTSDRLPGNVKDTSIPLIIPTRNPFSRLYSAFVDKSYLRLFPSINGVVRKLVSKTTEKRDLCLNDVSFSEFLEHVVVSARRRMTFNEHWAPVYSVCTPCDKNVTFIVKQESFATDVENALRHFWVNEDEIKVLKSVLHDHRIETSLPGIIRTVYLRTKPIRKCFTAEIMVKRIWTSFQIQGYVSNKVHFPAQNFTKSRDYENTEFVVKVLMETIMRSPLTSEESRSQRQQALAHAYKDINDTILTDIKKIYALDFKAFNYSETKPS